jgi:hypothetical protein
MRGTLADLFTAPLGIDSAKNAQPVFFATSKEVLEHQLSKCLPTVEFEQNGQGVRRFINERQQAGKAYANAFPHSLALVVQTMQSNCGDLMEELGFRREASIAQIAVRIGSTTHYMRLQAYSTTARVVIYISGKLVGLAPEVYAKQEGDLFLWMLIHA